jgi:hypothetical protein
MRDNEKSAAALNPLITDLSGTQFASLLAFIITKTDNPHI